MGLLRTAAEGHLQLIEQTEAAPNRRSGQSAPRTPGAAHSMPNLDWGQGASESVPNQASRTPADRRTMGQDGPAFPGPTERPEN
mmetsp:Transcript_21785/g.49189  ORF Transcript_21785/g.49189 Transcript_21785/m.49189 type:complete len:84 (-) Transcript_21785:497-748(-)